MQQFPELVHMLTNVETALKIEGRSPSMRRVTRRVTRRRGVHTEGRPSAPCRWQKGSLLVKADVDLTSVEVRTIEHVDGSRGLLHGSEFDDAPASASAAGLETHVRAEHVPGAFEVVLQPLPGSFPSEI